MNMCADVLIWDKAERAWGMKKAARLGNVEFRTFFYFRPWF